jgi:hypothetical protein
MAILSVDVGGAFDEQLDLHHLRYPKPVIPNVIAFDVCFLRDPLERLWSIYQHFRRSPLVDELSARAKELDSSSFFQLLIQEHAHLVNDAQVNLLANAGEYTRPPDAGDLAIALTIVRQMSVAGVADLFDESLVAAEYFLKPAFPNLRCEYMKQNVAPGDRTIRRAQLCEEVGAPVWAQLRTMNQLDEQLVGHARAEVERRSKLLPNAPERLMDFKRRCDILQQDSCQVAATTCTDSPI